MTFRLDPVNGGENGTVRWFIDGKEISRSDIFRERTVNIPEGEHQFRLELHPEFDGQFDQHKLAEFKFSYPVRIFVEFGDLSSNPQLDFDHEERVWFGELEEGTEFTFTASLPNTSSFNGWTGDLEGLLESDTISIAGPIFASASFNLGINSFATSGDLTWTVAPSGSLFIPSNGGLSFFEADGEATLTTTANGPGSLVIGVRNVESIELRIDGEIAEPSESSSQTFKDYLIPDGSHSFQIYLKSDPETFFLDEFNPLRLRAGIFTIDYLPGYLVRRQINGRGRLTSDPSGSTVPPGTSVTFTAELQEGNLFVGWSEPHHEQPNPFSKVITEKTTVEANFIPEAELGGLTWEYEGNPQYRTPTGTFPNGYFSFSLPPSEELRTQSASTTIEGPGILEFLWSTVASDLNPHLTIDGQDVDLGDLPIIVLVPEGLHQIVFKVNSPPITETSGGTFRLGLPDWKTEFTVSATGDSATVTVSPEKEIYSVGEALTFSAPATNEVGELFNGWWNSQTGKNYSSDPVWNTTVQGNMSATARYLAAPLLNDLSSISRDASGQWLLDETVLAPSGAASIRADEFTLLVITANEPCFVNFYVKTTPELFASLIVEGPFWGDSVGSGEDWIPYQVFLDTGERLSLRNQTNSEGTAGYIGDLTISPGWAPTVIRVRADDLVYSPSLEGLNNGEEFSAIVRPDLIHTFKGWLIGSFDIKSYEDAEPGIVGDHTHFRPWLLDSSSIEPPEGFSIENVSRGWVIYPPQTNNSQTTNWISTLAESNPTDINQLV
ncbi:MAG: hypothetical protein O3C20_24625 [Verrucomicrobia bacterium]|nr:hypothetical protein [Verrucomicrobiota bacterium]